MAWTYLRELFFCSSCFARSSAFPALFFLLLYFLCYFILLPLLLHCFLPSVDGHVNRDVDTDDAAGVAVADDQANDVDEGVAPCCSWSQ